MTRKSLLITDWQLAVKRLVNSWGSRSVLLLSQTCDGGIRDELIRSGGFEILARPIESANLLETLDLATARFALPAPRRQPAASKLMDSQVLR
jgi:hypothetical protein